MLGQGAWLVPEDNASDGTIRVIFKIYLVAIVLATAAIGGYAVKVIVRTRLLKGESVPLPVTTGWLSGGSLGHAIFNLRTLPGGPLGWIMIIFTALNIACDLSVAKAISRIFWPGRDTTSQYGMILDTGLPVNSYPDTVNGAYQRAFVAQYYANQNLQIINSNSGGYGIYRYIPANSEIYFMPAEQDIIGAWDCSLTTSQPIVYSGQEQGPAYNITGIVSDLVDRDLLYNVTEDGETRWTASYALHDETPNQTTWPTHLTIFTWDTIGTGSVFSYRIAVATQDLDANAGTKAMDTYECKLYAHDTQQTVFEVAKAINVSFATESYKDAIAGGIYPSINSVASFPADAISNAINYYLNSMIMVAGSGQNTGAANTRGYSYGIIMIVTIVPDWVLAICAVFGVCAILVSIATAILWSKSRALRREYDSSDSGSRVSSTDIFEHAPVGMLDWTKYATYRAGNGALNLANFRERDWIMTTQATRRNVIDIVSRKGDMESNKATSSSSQESVHQPFAGDK